MSQSSSIRRRSLLGLGAASVPVALGLSGCGSSGKSTAAGPAQPAALTEPAVKKGTLTFLEKYPDPQYAPYFKHLVAGYEKANPGVTVSLQAVADQPYKDKIKVLTSGKQLPDIFFSWAGDYTGEFVRADLVTDLSSVLDLGTPWGKQFTPAALRAYNYGGKQYGMPIDLDAKVFAYSTTAFAKAGVGVPATFDDLLTACDKLKAAGYQPIAFGNQFGWPAIHYITQLNAQEVPAATRNADYAPATGKFTDPGYVTALEKFQQLYARGMTQHANAISHENAQATMLQGKSAMMYLETFEFSLLTASGVPASFADHWDFFRMPAIPGAKGDQGALTGAPDGFLVSASSPNQALAVDFLKYFSNMTNAKTMVKQLGWLSPVVGSATAADTTVQNQQALKLIDSASDFAIWLDTVTSSVVANAYLAGAEALLDGTSTAAQVMASVQAAAKKAKLDA